MSSRYKMVACPNCLRTVSNIYELRALGKTKDGHQGVCPGCGLWYNVDRIIKKNNIKTLMSESGRNKGK